MNDLTAIINDPLLWIMGLPPIIVILSMAITFTKKAVDASESVGLSKKQCKDSFRVGLVSSIGPSLSIVTVILALMASMGTATAWSRLSMVGSAPQKVMMAQVGAELFQTTVGGEGYTAAAYAASVWMMTFHGCNFMIAVFFLLHKIEKVKNALGKKNEVLLPIIGAGALAGVIAMLGMGQAKGSVANAFSFVFAAILTYCIGLIAKRVKWLGEYKVGFSMLISMLITQYIFKYLMV
jgi:hypothetical protein